eukprot:scaffold902_cov242-Pinguiococcus_pyrenoidosus.AAC.11
MIRLAKGHLAQSALPDVDQLNIVDEPLSSSKEWRKRGVLVVVLPFNGEGRALPFGHRGERPLQASRELTPPLAGKGRTRVRNPCIADEKGEIYRTQHKLHRPSAPPFRVLKLIPLPIPNPHVKL